MERQKVVVGMSGGIDSSVAAALLHKQDYSCIGVQMNYWTETICLDKNNIEINRFRKRVENKCCSDESKEITRQICKFLGIPFYSLDVVETFKTHIVDNYLEGFSEGKTPNPCIECNKNIKFGALLDFAQSIGATTIATGHYGQVRQNSKLNEFELHQPVDTHKDQTYFLSGLTQKQLSSSLLPLGRYTKDQVRTLAKEMGLDVYKKNYKESQGLCFFPEKTPQAFLERNVPELLIKGDIKTLSGDTVGKHTGVHQFTIGQRKGINIGGLKEPYFVSHIDFDSQTVYIGPKEQLYKSRLLIQDIHFINSYHPQKLDVQIRYGMKPVQAYLEKGSEGYIVTFSEPVYAITPGQIAVFRDGSRIVGQGVIEKSLDEM